MEDMTIHNLVRYKELRSELRKAATEAELVLWDELKGGMLGCKFRRQQSFGRYIVDFYCPKRKLIIELDGEVHSVAEVVEYGAVREKELTSAGFFVLRFSNQAVFENMSHVLYTIRLVCDQQKKKDSNE